MKDRVLSPLFLAPHQSQFTAHKTFMWLRQSLVIIATLTFTAFTPISNAQEAELFSIGYSKATDDFTGEAHCFYLMSNDFGFYAHQQRLQLIASRSLDDNENELFDRGGPVFTLPILDDSQRILVRFAEVDTVFEFPLDDFLTDEYEEIAISEVNDASFIEALFSTQQPIKVRFTNLERSFFSTKAADITIGEYGLYKEKDEFDSFFKDCVQ